MNGLSILRNWYRSLLTIVVWVSLAVAPGAAWAQQIFELEGKINGIDAGARTITVMDIVVHVPEGLSIDTPTGSIPLSGPGSLSDPALPSLVGVATAIITGERDDLGNSVADSAFVEIAENVMLATVTAVDSTEMVVNDTGRIRINSPGSGVGDSRFEAIVHPSANITVFGETGYPMALPGPETTTCVVVNPADPASPFKPLDSSKACAIAVGDLVGGEGDFRTQDGASYVAAHTVEVGRAVLYTPADVPAPFRDYVVIIGRTLIEEDELSVRGFGTFPGTTVSVFRAADDCSAIGAAVATETVSTVDGRWRAVNVPVSGDFPNVLARTTDGATYCVGADRR